MEIINDHQSFRLDILGPDGSSDGGLQWLVVAIVVRLGEQTFRATGPWLTTIEQANLSKFLASSARRIPGILEFIEPNLSFQYEPETSNLTIALELEARPEWLPLAGLSFSVTSEELALAAQQLERAN